MKKIINLFLTILVVAVTGAAYAERDYIQIVGSSTVYPFVTVVAERYGKSTKFKTPIIESTGSGGGLKLFCAGVGGKHPDITNSSRRIKPTEFEKCQTNGATDIIEVKIGYDGIIVGNHIESAQLKLSRRDIFLALAKDIPNPDGSETLISNPYITWQDVNPDLPAIAIEVLGPPPTSGTRDAFAELALEGGCKKFDWIKAMKKSDKSAYKTVCHTIREDGAYIEAGENDNLIIQKLRKNPKALGVFGFSFLDQNSDVIQGSIVDNALPGFDEITNGSYPLSRPLYFYVKAAHIGVVPGIQEFLNFFTEETAWGSEGYLTDKGLIPMQEDERKKFMTDARDLNPLVL